MAGAGYKLFNTGDVLTAAQVNTYLQEQAVMVFADATARTTALSGVLAEGMISYLKDTNAVEKYDGSSWVSVGGGASPLTTKGDLYTYSTTDTRLAVGTNGHVLTADSSTATGLKWAAAAAGGKVLQVVSATYSTATTIATTTLTDTGLTASITPSATSSKILIIISQQVYQSANFRQLGGLSHRLFRGTTEIYETGGTSDFSSQFFNGGNNSAAEICDVLPMVYLDSPNTTSSTTYKTQAKLSTTNNSSTSTFQLNSADSSIILMEIGA